MSANYYDTLGVAKGATDTEIKSAYRREALKWHPDRHTSGDKTEAEKRFKEINEAYQVLSDPQKKSQYDQFGHIGNTPSGNPFPGGFSGQQGPFTYTYTTQGGANPFENFGDPFDIFESFFGGGFGRRAPRLPQYSIQIDFIDSIEGVEKEVKIEGKKRKIKIPKGVEDGTRINFKDFILTIKVKPDKIFKRDGADIYLNLNIPYSLAVFGGNIEVPTVRKEVKIKIRPGTQPGSMLRLKGEGAPHLNSRSYGDQYIKINVEIPQRLSHSQKRVVEDLKSEGL